MLRYQCIKVAFPLPTHASSASAQGIAATYNFSQLLVRQSNTLNIKYLSNSKVKDFLIFSRLSSRQIFECSSASLLPQWSQDNGVEGTLQKVHWSLANKSCFIAKFAKTPATASFTPTLSSLSASAVASVVEGISDGRRLPVSIAPPSNFEF
jgi:hypothetical protein